LKTYLSSDEATSLHEIDGPAAHAALETIAQRAGRPKPVPRRSRASSTSSSSDGASRDPPPAAADFPPDQLRAFLDRVAVTDFDNRRSSIDDWLRYWLSVGRGGEALDAFEAVALSVRRAYELEESFDVAFDVALKVHGRTKAMPWIIRAHVVRYGWNRWFTDEKKVLGRIQTFAKHFPGQWREFIRQTGTMPTGLPSDDGSISIGLSRLVAFLVEVNELDAAWAYAQEMAHILREELSAQPIKTPKWAA
jgi:hypothetical protein